jgi:2-dehydropantoate 2-reductase
MKLKYAVVGTGAIGGFYGGKLVQSGQSVDFLVHSDYEQVKQHGLKIDSVMGNFHLNDLSVFNNTADMKPSDVVLVCLKTTHNYLLKDILPPLLHRDTLVVVLQNGLGMEADLAKEFPGLNIAGGLTIVSAVKVAPGHISHLTYGKMSAGAYQVNDSKVFNQVCEDFINAGIPVDTNDLMLSRWRKLVWNIPFSGLSVLFNTTTDKLLQNEDSKQLCQELMFEVIEGANYFGRLIKRDFADTMFGTTELMGVHSPSMKIDHDNKRIMEIESIYTRPLKEALAAGYNMKLVAMLEKQLKFIQSQQ